MIGRCPPSIFPDASNRRPGNWFSPIANQRLHERPFINLLKEKPFSDRKLLAIATKLSWHEWLYSIYFYFSCKIFSQNAVVEMETGGRAVEELAKLGQKSLETAERLGAWVDTVFRGAVLEASASLQDTIAGYRIRNRVKVLQKTKAALEKSGMNVGIRPIDIRIGMPLIDAISEESDETLQDVWSAYIKNALDPKKPNPDRLLIDIIRRLEPADWPILSKCFFLSTGEDVSEHFDISDPQLQNSLDRMGVLGLFEHQDDTIYIVNEFSSIRQSSIVIDASTYKFTRLLIRLRDALESN